MPILRTIRYLKTETYALSLAYRDPRTPWYARVWAVLVVGYAFSPIDLIPDFIPVLGYLDDLLLLPLGIWVALKLIPDEVMSDARSQAAASYQNPTCRVAVIGIVAIWLLLGLGGIVLARQVLAG